MGNKADEVSHQKSSGGGFEVGNKADEVSHQKSSGGGFEVGNKADEVSHQKSSSGGFEAGEKADEVSHKSTASLTQTIVCLISNLQQFPKLLELTKFEFDFRRVLPFNQKTQIRL